MLGSVVVTPTGSRSVTFDKLISMAYRDAREICQAIPPRISRLAFAEYFVQITWAKNIPCLGIRFPLVPPSILKHLMNVDVGEPTLVKPTVLENELLAVPVSDDEDPGALALNETCCEEELNNCICVSCIFEKKLPAWRNGEVFVISEAV